MTQIECLDKASKSAGYLNWEDARSLGNPHYMGIIVTLAMEDYAKNNIHLDEVINSLGDLTRRSNQMVNTIVSSGIENEKITRLLPMLKVSISTAMRINRQHGNIPDNEKIVQS